MERPKNNPEPTETNRDQSFQTSLKYLEMLKEKQNEQGNTCRTTDKQIEFTRGLVINTVLRAYGGFGHNEAMTG